MATASTAPLFFPVREEVPEGKLHAALRTALHLILNLAFAKDHSIGNDQFVYWDPKNPKRCLAPDAFVKLGEPDTLFPCWKVWEHGGPPDVAVEIVSDFDRRRWTDKVADYEELGVRELVRYDANAAEGQRLQIWDRLGARLVARAIQNDVAESNMLEGLRWATGPSGPLPIALRLIDAQGQWLPSPEEAAERRIAELEAELARRG